MTSLKNYSLLLLLFVSLNAFAQPDSFQTKEQYFEYSSKKFGIQPEEIYYVSTEADGRNENPLEKFSLLMFFKNDRIATIEDASNHSACPAPKLIRQASLDAIEKSMTKSASAGTVVFKNMADGTLFIPEKDEMFALLFYSYKLGNTGQEYIKQRKKLSETLGIKTIILSIDGAYIEEITDIPKTSIRKE